MSTAAVKPDSRPKAHNAWGQTPSRSSPAPTPTPTNGNTASANGTELSAADRLTGLLAALVGSQVNVHAKGGRLFRGLLASATTATAAELGVVLHHVLTLDPSTGEPTPKQQPVKTLVLLARDVLEIEAVELDADSPELALEPVSATGGFKVDGDITTGGTTTPDTRERRELHAWQADPSSAALEGLGASSTKGWDQFAANERLYGTKTNYDEEIYTTKLDRSGKDYKEREKRAARLEMEILKGTGLSSNPHMQEERLLNQGTAAVDDSGLDEEDRYGAVIRGPGAYVPPGARRGGGTPVAASASGKPVVSVTPAPEDPPAAAATTAAPKPSPTPPSRLPPAVTAAPQPPKPSPSPTPSATSASGESGLVPSFRQFVSTERERLVQKKQSLVKSMEKKEQDTRLASLLEFSQNFKLKSPVPADIASLTGKSTSPSGSAASTPSKPPPASLPAKPKGAAVIPEIPPFKSPKPAAAAAVVEQGEKPKDPAQQKKINPNAPAFRPNPQASSFTPGTNGSSSSSSSSRPAVTLPPPVVPPSNPFFGTATLKRGSSSMHVKEDFSPLSPGKSYPVPGSILPSWGFGGKSFRPSFPNLQQQPSHPGADEDGLVPTPQQLQQLQAAHQAQQQGGPPNPFGYPPPPPPPGFRFQPPPGSGPGQQQQQQQQQMGFPVPFNMVGGHGVVMGGGPPPMMFAPPPQGVGVHNPRFPPFSSPG